MGVERQILQQLIDERTAVVEARRLGLQVSDAEVAQRIIAIPAFQQNGVFAGEDVYSRVLESQRPPLSKAEFEDNLRRSLLVEKLHSALTDWVVVPDSDVTSEYRRRNEKAKVELVVFSADKLRDQVTVSDADLAAWFDGHKETYRIGEKRKIKFLLVDVEALRAKILVAPAEVEKYYRQNQPQYVTPAQVRASHILLKTEGKDDAAVKAKAEALLKQVRAGGNFADLAKKNSEDEASAKNGGDLDYFGHGRMVKEFEDAAFALEPGQISDLVKSPFGYHIIKLVDKKPETTKTLAEVQQQIADQLAYERAATQASQHRRRDRQGPQDGRRSRPRRQGARPDSAGVRLLLEGRAGRRPRPVPEITEQAFTTAQGTVAGPARTPRGLVFFAPTGTQASRLPVLAEVKDKVREDAIGAKARELTRARAASLATDLHDELRRRPPSRPAWR